MASYDDTATVSGSVAYFSDGADEVPCKSVKDTLPASLTGYNSASVVNSGKNLLDYADITNSYRVTSLTDNGGGSFTVVASGLGAYIDHVIKVKAGQAYSIKCTSATNDEGNASQIGVVNVYDGSDDTATLLLNGASISTRKGFTPTGNYILVRNKVTGGSGAGTGTMVEPQLEIGSSASSYEPYIAPTTYSANLGRTVYGGEVDLVSGTGKDTGAIHTITSENVNELIRLDGHRFYIHNRNTHCITPSTDDADSVVCDKLKSQTGGSVYDNRCFINASGAIRINTTSEYATNSDFLEDFGGSITFAFILDPSYYTDFTFDGQEIPTRKGYNAFSSVGNMEVTYYKDGYGFTSVTVNKQQSKNLFEAFTKGYSINASTGAIVRSNAAAISNYIRVSEGVRYSLTGLTNTIHSFISYYKADKTTWISRTSGNNKTELINFTPPTGAMFALVCQYATGTDAGSISDIDGLQTQFEMGEVASEYEPYEAVSKTAKFHRIVYGGQADVVKGTCEPKNILLPSDTDSASTVVNGVTRSYSLNSQTWTLEGTNTKTDANWLIYNGANYVLSKTLVVGDTYTYSHTLSANCYSQLTYKDTNGATRAIGYLAGNANKNASVTFTVPSDFVELLRFQIGVVKTATSVSEEAVFQLEKASSKTEYTPYFDPFTFPPISMETDEGENTLFANEGDSSITYRKAVD